MPITPDTIETDLALRVMDLAWAIVAKGCAPGCPCEVCVEFRSTADDYTAVIEEEKRDA